MSLPPGTRFGVYEIVAPLGAGGMGEVFRARDTDLDREVALKLLPSSFANDPDRLMRFDREAKTLASLNHPHIAQIYGIATHDATRALVMELIDGDDLSHRLASGPLNLDDALSIAKQIADALEAAHDRGIIHRDLKPANIRIRTDGTVKVLDFGLAKNAPDHQRVEQDNAAVANSPTITSPAMTHAGIVLGTAPYMSPEQAKGKPVDQRADVWAFGCVLYEMLTGRRAFDGTDVGDVLAAIIRGEPDWSALPSDCPSSIRRLLRRCLQKDLHRRLRNVGDARLDLEEPDATVGNPAHPTTSRWAALSAWIIAAVATGVAITAVGWPRAAERRDLVHLSFRLPQNLTFRAAAAVGILALSPDGRLLVVRTVNDLSIFLKSIASPEFVRLPAQGTSPFFSPDSQWLAYFDDGTLKKINVSGGQPPAIICRTDATRGAWADDGTIVLISRSGVSRVSAGGGAPVPVLGQDSTLTENVTPVVLPGSKVMLVRALSSNESWIRAFRFADQHMANVVQGSNPRLVGSLLVFDRDGALWAAPFDVASARVTGPTVAVPLPIQATGPTFVYATSTSGTIAFIAPKDDPTELTWIDRRGLMRPAVTAPGLYSEPQLSPDDKDVVVSMSATAGGPTDLYVINLERETTRKVTTDGGRRARWSSSGLLAYQNTRQNIRIRAADGTGDVQEIDLPNGQYPDAWSPDGKMVIFNEGSLTRDLWAVPLSTRTPFRVTPPSSFGERGARVSPDGKLIAFVSDESGRDEVYLQPFPGPGAKTVISRSGGRQPVWSRNGRELFYRAGDTLMAVSIGEQPQDIGRPVALFELRRSLFGDDPNRVEYDVAADGRFLAAKAMSEMTQPEITMILNWADSFRSALGQ